MHRPHDRTGQDSPLPGLPPLVQSSLVVPSSHRTRPRITCCCSRYLPRISLEANRQSCPPVLMKLDRRCKGKRLRHGVPAPPFCTSTARPNSSVSPSPTAPRANGLSCMASPPAVRDGEREAGTAGRDGGTDRPPPLSPLSGVGDMSTTNLFGPEGTRASNCGRQNAAGMSPSQTLDAGRGRMRPSDGHPAAVLCMHGSNHVRSPSSTRVGSLGAVLPQMPSPLAVGPRLPGLVGALLCRF